MATLVSNPGRSLLLLAVLVLAGLSFWAASARAQVPEPQIPQDLRVAIKAEVEARNQKYAGLCREINQVQYVGQWCAFVQSLTDTRAEVTFGAVLSDQIHAATFNRSNLGWVLATGVVTPSPASTATPSPTTTSTHTPSVSADLRAAIRVAVESRGETFAGMCREIEQAQHLSQWCALVVSLSATRAEVTFGPVLSDDIHKVTFTKSGNTWTRPGAVAPPSTGDAGLRGEGLAE